MTGGFDARLLRVGVEVAKRLVWYEGLAIEASMTKVANATANEATIKVTNIEKQTRNTILTETSPWNKFSARKRVIVEAGRQSYGYSRIFVGDIMNVSVTQPPDIAITISALTNAWNKTQVASRSYAGLVQARQIAQDIADSMGLALQYEADDKQISSYAFTGAKSAQMNKLSELGRVNAYIDDDRLVVKPIGVALKQTATASNVLDIDSGMVGIPEVTEQGIKVKMMFEPHSRIGGTIQVRSKINPGANGEYIIFKMTYDLSNREDQFYNTVEAYKKGRYLI